MQQTFGFRPQRKIHKHYVAPLLEEQLRERKANARARTSDQRCLACNLESHVIAEKDNNCRNGNCVCLSNELELLGIHMQVPME